MPLCDKKYDQGQINIYFLLLLIQVEWGSELWTSPFIIIILLIVPNLNGSIDIILALSCHLVTWHPSFLSTASTAFAR